MISIMLHLSLIHILFVGVASFIEAVQAVQEKDTFRSIPYTAVGLSAVATVLWLALYMLGILL